MDFCFLDNPDTHTENTVYQCNNCDKLFANNTILNDHICENSFKNATSLNKHMEIHNSDNTL